MRKGALDFLKDVGIHIDDPERIVEELSGGQRQAVAISKGAYWTDKILILDEPTAALGVRETGRILNMIIQLKKKGLSIILITHNMEHAFLVADRFFVLRVGEKVGERKKRDEPRRDREDDHRRDLRGSGQPENAGGEVPWPMLLSSKKRKNFISFFPIREIGALLPLIVIFILVGLQLGLRHLPNLLDMLRATSYIFIVGVGMTFVLCGRGLDLSVGSQVGMSGVVLGALMVSGGTFRSAVAILTLLVGAAAGALNGFFITVFGIPPFIATLATYYSYRGIFRASPRARRSPRCRRFQFLGQGMLFGVSYVILFIALLGAVATFVLRKTKYGRYTLAMGGNAESTRLSGIKTRLIFSPYVVIGVLAFISGIFFTSRFTSAQPTTGVGMELRVIAACIIGGVSLFGGAGSIVGTFVGSFFLVVLDNGMIMAHISGYWQQAVIGVIIIVAVVIDLARKRELFKKE